MKKLSGIEYTVSKVCETKSLPESTDSSSDLIANEELHELTRRAICKKLRKYSSTLSTQMHEAGMHSYSAVYANGVRNIYTSGTGYTVNALFKGKYDPFITMSAQIFEDDLPIPTNVNQPRRQPNVTEKALIPSRIQLEYVPNQATGRKQIQAILQNALSNAQLIPKNATYVPWSTLEDDLKNAKKTLVGWPNLSRSIFKRGDYKFFTKNDAKMVLEAQRDIKIVNISKDEVISAADESVLGIDDEDVMVGPNESVLTHLNTHWVEEEDANDSPPIESSDTTSDDSSTVFEDMGPNEEG